MQNKRKAIQFLIGLTVIFCLATFAFAGSVNDKKKKQKRPKNTGILTVKTAPQALPVKIDGQQIGMSGVGEPAEFYLTPGIHLLEVEGPNGTKYSRELNIEKNVKTCICLNTVERTTTRPCPYDIEVNGPEKVTEGDLATFFARNLAQAAEAPSLKYVWRVSPSTARITSGQGTESITVDTTNLGGRTLSVEVDTTDGVYDASCRQTKSITTEVDELPKEVPPEPIVCDVFASVSPDDDKARFDNCLIEIQNNPGARLYIVINPGTDRLSTRRNTFERVSKRANDYFVGNRKLDPSRIDIVRGPQRETTTYQIWIVPTGARTPDLN